MKKFTLLTALLPLVGMIAFAPNSAHAQAADPQGEFERAWYDNCYTKKDVDKCYEQSKELVNKYPKSSYLANAQKNIKQYEQGKAWEKFQADFEAFGKQQDSAKLEALFADGDSLLQVVPDPQDPVHLIAIGRLALAGQQAAIQKTYDKLDKVKDYADRAMNEFQSAQPTEKTKKDFDEYVLPMKDLVIAYGYQFLGFRLIETKGSVDQALDLLAKATQVKGKNNVGWKDPNNYWLRSTIYSNQYSDLSKQYAAMSNEEKTSDAGKDILKKVNELLDTKLIPEYARVLATANSPEGKPLYDAAKPQFDALWKFRTDAADKAPDYIKNYANDPTIPNVPVPAKAEDTSLNAPVAPAADVAKPTAGASKTVRGRKP